MTVATAARPATRARPLWAVAAFAGLALVAVVAPIALAQHYGALRIPRSDDWSYLHTMFLWHRTGHWDFNDWVSMTLVGQVLLSVPVVGIFGESITALSVTWAVAGFGGLLAVVYTGRRLGLPPPARWLVALSIGSCPLWGPLAPTFMTDVPAFAFEMAALALALVAVARPAARSWLVASVAVAFVGFSIRQYALVPLVVILAVAAWVAAADGDRRRLRAVGLLAVAAAVAAVALLAWWQSVPNGKSLSPRVPTYESFRLAFANAGGFARLAGIMLLPVIVWGDPRAVIRRAFRADAPLARLVVAVAGAWLLVGWAARPVRPFVGNYFEMHGVLADDVLAGRRPRLMPSLAFDALVVVGSLAALVLVLAAVPFLSALVDDVRAKRLRRPDPAVAILGLCVAGFLAAYSGATLVRISYSELTAVFDRYALPALPLVGLLYLRATRAAPALEPGDDAGAPGSGRATAAWSAVALAGLAFLGIAYTAESASFDGTRWKVAEMAVASGYHPLQVDNGYEWVGWFRGTGPVTGPTIAARRKLRAEYFRGLCVTVSVDPPPRTAQVVAEARSPAPTRRPARIVASRNTRDCAAPGPTAEAMLAAGAGSQSGASR